MNFPPFWAKGECKRFSCWGWSNNSLAEAQAAGRANAQRAMSRSEANEMVKHHYGYGDDRPLREPVLREFKDAAGERHLQRGGLFQPNFSKSRFVAS